MDAICWLDIETTGLIPEEDAILEVAVILTNMDLETISARSMIVDGIWGKPSDLWDDVVLKMHTESGLLASLNAKPRSASTSDYADVEFHEFIGFNVYNANIDKLYLGGNSVHFDRSFLKVHMPRTERLFHYRHLDMSALKIFLRMVEVELDVKEIEPKHRAMNDALSSLEYCKAARSKFAWWIDEVARNEA